MIELVNFRYGFKHPPHWNLEINPHYGGKDFRRAAKRNEVPQITYNFVVGAVKLIQDRIRSEVIKRMVFPNLGNFVVPVFPTPEWYRN